MLTQLGNHPQQLDPLLEPCRPAGIRRGIVKHTNDGDIVLGSLELPEGNVDRDTTLTLGLKLVQNPGVLEGTLAKLGGCVDRKSALFPGGLLDRFKDVDEG